MNLIELNIQDVFFMIKRQLYIDKLNEFKNIDFI